MIGNSNNNSISNYAISSSYLQVGTVLLLMIDGKVRSLSALLAPYSGALSVTCRKLDLLEYGKVSQYMCKVHTSTRNQP